MRGCFGVFFTFLSPALFVLLNFLQCVKTSKGYMETAALCKYLWCNISMWIDFLPNPSIITGISWKPTSRWRLRALGSSDRSGVSPSHSKYLFFFWLGAAQLWGHFMCQPLRFHSALTSKPTLAHCFCDVAAGPETAQTEKCDVGQITELCPWRKNGILTAKTQSPGYRLTLALVRVIHIPFYLSVAEPNGS